MRFVLRYSIYVLCLCVGGGVMAGCGSTDASDYGDWTLQEEGLTLTEDLRVSETESFFFGAVSDLDVTSDGRMVVADREASNIKVLQPDGTLIDTLGGPGEGPGEFQTLVYVQLARGDSLYAYDIQRSRLTVFAPDSPYELSRSVTFSRENGYVTDVHVLDNRLAAAFSPGRAPEEGVERPGPRVWRWVSDSGTPGDTLMHARRGRRLVSEMGDGMFRVYPIPFRRTAAVAVDERGMLYRGWTDSLRIVAHEPNGPSEVVASVPSPRVPVQEAERDSTLQELDADVRSTLASAMPDTKPAFRDLVVADDGRLWVQRPFEAPTAEMSPWWILNPETQTIQQIHLPREVNIEVVRDGLAYGTTTTDMGAPAIVRYRVETDSHPT